MKSRAIAHPNIAFIKYWGNRDHDLNLPVNGSLSMNLGALTTCTDIEFDNSIPADALILNDQKISGSSLERVGNFLDHFRKLSGKNWKAKVISRTNFPVGAGIASSASGFAALAVAAAKALELNLSQTELSRLARLGSGSACRSIPGGFVEWQSGRSDQESYAVSIASHDHWDLVDCIAIIQTDHKSITSKQGHTTAHTSPLQEARISGADIRLKTCREAILDQDFQALSSVIELDSNLMHAVMMTSNPSLFYWKPASLQIMKLIPEWRKEGLEVCYTLDAGPNVHAICTRNSMQEISKRLGMIDGVKKVIQSPPGGPAG